MDFFPAPTIDGLDELFDRVRATGLDVCFERSGQPFALSAAVELTLYRIAEEALTNTLKHAGATKVSVELRYDHPVVRLEVADDGAGAVAFQAGEPTGPGGHGVEGMRERANLHGDASGRSIDSGGWVVSVTVRDAARA